MVLGSGLGSVCLKQSIAVCAVSVKGRSRSMVQISTITTTANFNVRNFGADNDRMLKASMINSSKNEERVVVATTQKLRIQA